MPLRVPATVTGLEASIEAAAKKAGKNLKINLGAGAKSIEGLSQPLGRISGKADQFTKSMEAANARVLAFGASVGVLSAVTRGFKELIVTTIQVEKQLASINSILRTTTTELANFKKTIFDVARGTEQSFDTVANAALELSRQGLSAEKVVSRLNDALILSRLSGLGASEAVAGLTAAINSFNREGVTSAEVLNKLSAASIKAAVSERDLIEGIKRSGSVATIAGVSLNELIGVISAVQEKTARGGAVIGNSFKTIFTRIQSLDKLRTMQDLGVQISDTSGNILSATKLIQNLARALENVPDAKRLQISEKLVGKFQIAPFLAILDDYNSKTSVAIKITEVAANATTEAYTRNVALNKTLSTAINEATVNLKELANTLGEIGVTDSLRNVLSFFNSLVGNIKEVLEGEGLGSDFARGIVKGIGNIISGPGLAIFGAVLAKLTYDLVRFGAGSLKTFFGLNRAAKAQAVLQGQIASTLLGNKGIQQQILAIENSTLSTEQKRAAQTKFFTVALNEQMRIMTQMQAIAARIAPAVARGTRGGRGRAAGGFIPNFDAVRGYGTEQSDIARGVGGAPSSARPVNLPNFNFGGGQRGSITANSSEFVVSDFAGSGGSAIFNQDMVSSMGLPAGAKKIGAAGGYIPNFQRVFRFGEAAGTATQRAAGVISAGVGGRYGGQTVTQADLDRATKFRKDNPTAQQAAAAKRKKGGATQLNVRGYMYGVAALFPSKKSTATSTTFAEDPANPGVIALKKRGYTGMRMTGIQISDLETMQRNKKKGMSQAENRRTIGRLFSEPLLRYGSEVIGDTFSNDENTNIKNEIKTISKRGESSALFSSSVEGGIFESAINLVTKGAKAIKEFKDHKTEKQPFDFEEGGRADSKFKKAFGFTNSLVRADAKRTASNEAVQTLIFKALNDPIERPKILKRAPTLKGGKAAAGYIPNFAGSLEDAIGRESAAGLPVNQIRVNQNPRLRNAGNPMGLAVTNTRDEPTGRVPNFAKTKAGGGGAGGAGGAGDAFGGLVGKLLILQIAFSSLSGILSEVTNENKSVAASLKALNIAITAMMITSMISPKMGAGGMWGAMTGKAGHEFRRGGVARASLGMEAMRTPGAFKGGRALGVLKGGGMAVAGGAQAVGGALMTVIGPIAAVGVAAWAVAKAFDVTSGRAEQLRLNQEALAVTTAIATKSLSELRIPDEFKGNLRKSAASFAKESVGDLGQGRSGGLFNWRKWGGDIKGGLDKDIKKNLEGTLEAARTQGLSSQFINQQYNALDRERQKRGQNAKFTQEEITIFQEKFQMLNQLEVGEGDNKRKIDFDAQSVINAVSNSLTPELIKEIEAASKIKARAKAGLGEITNLEKLEIHKTERDIIDASKGITGASVIDRELLTSGVGQKVTEGTTERQKIDTIRGDAAKLRLKTEIEILRINSKALTNDQKTLSRAQTLGSLDALALKQLQKKVALNEHDRKLDEDISKIIEKQVDGLESLVISEDAQVQLSNIIREGDLKALATKEQRLKIVKETIGLDGIEGDHAEAVLEKFVDQVKSKEDLSKASKKILEDGLKQNILDQKSLDIANQRLEVLKRGNILRSAARSDLLERSGIRITAAQSAIQDNPNLTTRERDQQLFNLLPKVQGDQKRGFANEVLDKLSGAVEEMSKPIHDLNDFLFELKKSLNAKNITDKGLERVLEDVGLLTLAEGAIVQGKGGNKDDLRVLQDFFKQLITLSGGFATLKLQLTEEEIAAKRRLNTFRDADTLLRDFVQGLRQATEQLKQNAIFARSGAEFVSGARSFRENRLREAAGETNVEGQLDITRDFTLQGLQDLQRRGLSRAERTDATRELPLVKQQFELQKKLNALMREAQPDYVAIEQIEREILDIERKRLLVNQSISALIDKTFFKSAEDIERQLGKSLISDAEQFKKTVTDGMVDAIVLGQDLGDTLQQAATNFFSNQAKAQLEAAFSGIISMFKKGATGPIPQGGERGGLGDVLISSIGGVGNFISGLLGFGQRAHGGLITGGSGHRDDIPTLLQGGEFVVKKDSVEKYGTRFFEDLNTGRVGQMQRGGFHSPGTYGQGSIVGTENLMDFGTQRGTSGQQDLIGGGEGLAYTALEPQSNRLTMFGRRFDGRFATEQDSKRESVGLAFRQLQLEAQYEEKKKKEKEAFWASMKVFMVSLGVSAAAQGLQEYSASKTQAKLGTSISNQRGNIDSAIVEAGGSPRGLFSGIGSSGIGSSGIGSGIGSSGAGRTSAPLPMVSLPETLSSRHQITGLANYIPNMTPRGVVPTDAVNGSWTNQMFEDWFELPVVERVIQLRRTGDHTGASHAWRFGRGGGGPIPYAPGIDTVPINASGGEFMLNAAAAQNIGPANLSRLNAGGEVGGDDSTIVARLDELIAVTDGNGETIINITINSDGTETQDTNGDEEQQNLASRLGDKVREVLLEEQRIGGILRRV